MPRSISRVRRAVVAALAALLPVVPGPVAAVEPYYSVTYSSENQSGLGYLPCPVWVVERFWVDPRADGGFEEVLEVTATVPDWCTWGVRAAAWVTDQGLSLFPSRLAVSEGVGTHRAVATARLVLPPEQAGPMAMPRLFGLVATQARVWIGQSSTSAYCRSRTYLWTMTTDRPVWRPAPATDC